jgi:hypothetical protein
MPVCVGPGTTTEVDDVWVVTVVAAMVDVVAEVEETDTPTQYASSAHSHRFKTDKPQYLEHL